MFDLIPAHFYRTFYLILFGILGYLKVFQLGGQANDTILYKPKSNEEWNKALVLSVFLILFFGLRDPFSKYFADTLGYTGRYNDIKTLGEQAPWYSMFNESTSEIIWNKSVIILATGGVDVTFWYLLVATTYILPILFAVKKLLPNQIYTAILFAYLNFGFYGGAINGIRNGVGLSIVLLGLSLLTFQNRKLLLALFLFAIAYEIHSSTILPAICILASIYLIKNPTWAIFIWILCVLISLIIGNSLAGFFEDFGFDERISYITEAGMTEDGTYTVATGGIFRWDFLLFSIVPIIWGGWVLLGKNIKDRAYQIIYCTYVLANSFWVLVIRASFSNRFAMLSWFLYFLVLIYPLLKHNIVPKQGQLIGIMLIGMYLVSTIL